MPGRITKHAKRRMRSRNVGRASARRASYGSGTHIGGGKYKATKGGVTTVYRKKNGKRIIITTWREKPGSKRNR